MSETSLSMRLIAGDSSRSSRAESMSSPSQAAATAIGSGSAMSVMKSNSTPVGMESIVSAAMVAMPSLRFAMNERAKTSRTAPRSR